MTNLSTMAYMAMYQALLDGRMFLRCQTFSFLKDDVLFEFDSLRVKRTKKLLIKTCEYTTHTPLLLPAIALGFVC